MAGGGGLRVIAGLVSALYAPATTWPELFL